MKILTINPGSTSTKIGVFEDEKKVLEKTIRHDIKEMDGFDKIIDQYDFRKDTILNTLKEEEIAVNTFDAIVGRGGLLKSIPSGTYAVNDAMLADLRVGLQGEHASNLGGLIAFEIAKGINKPAFIVDPVIVDELTDVARVSGHPLFQRRSIFHALNQKAIARQYCKDTGQNYTDVTLIVAHLGGGVSVGVHQKGKVIDVNNALNGEGAFSPERSGTLPAYALAELCFSGQYSLKEVKAMITGKGGVVAHLGLNDMREVVAKAETDPKARLIVDAMIYQVAKEIGSMAPVVNGKVDAILLTGGISFDKMITQKITEKVSFITKVVCYPGEDELVALAQGALRVLNGEEQAKVY